MDLHTIIQSALNAPVAERIHALLSASGCQFDAQYTDIVVRPAIHIVHIGGIPCHGMHPDIATAMKRTMGACASLSYLSGRGKNPLDLYTHVVGALGHASVAHATQVGVWVAGISCAVANEWNSQRDHVHLARITEARTRIQDAPPWIAIDPGMVAHVDALRTHTVRMVDALHAAHPTPTDQQLESINTLHAACKATAFLATGSLRQWQRVLDGRTDMGKEYEYRRVLDMIHASLSPHFPELFPS